MEGKRHSVKRAGITVMGCVLLVSITAVAQEVRSEVSVQGTGFFTKDASGNGIKDKATETGGVLVGYRYNITRWLAAEATYGYDRNTQSYIGNTSARVQSNIHQITGSAVVKLPGFARIQPYAFQPDILIMLRTDSKRVNEYSSEFSMENTTGGARVPGSFVRHRVLAGAGR
jgi:hypothetical protein